MRAGRKKRKGARMGHEEYNPVRVYAVLDALGIEIRQEDADEIKSLVCPFCERKKLYANKPKALFYCFKCGEGWSASQFYADVKGISKEDAIREIKEMTGEQPSDPSRPVQKIMRSHKKIEKAEEAEIAPENKVHSAYEVLLSVMNLEKEDRQNLLDRGLKEQEIDNLRYKTFLYRTDKDPKIWNIVDAISLGVETASGLRPGKNPNGTQKNIGVPGFFRTGKGNLTFWFMHKPAIAMPCINRNGHISGIQLRIRDSALSEDDSKCTWFTSRNKKGGCGARPGVHYAVEWNVSSTGKKTPIFPDGVAYLTEGIMKADIAHACDPSKAFISIPGVNMISALSAELDYLKYFGVNKIVIAYDRDMEENPNVAKALKRVNATIKEKGIETAQLVWARNTVPGEDLKGIDDFLVYHKRGILPSAHKVKK